MNAYAKDREWSDIYLPQIRQIVGPLLLTPAPLELDVTEATDLVILQARDMRIGCRVRRPGYADRYPFEFTIRSKRDTGAITEMSKIVDGWGDWIFYGHINDLDEIWRWFVVDLHSFRSHLIREGYREQKRIRRGEKPNGDGTHFMWFDLQSFPPNPPICIATSHPLSSLEAA